MLRLCLLHPSRLYDKRVPFTVTCSIKLKLVAIRRDTVSHLIATCFGNLWRHFNSCRVRLQKDSYKPYICLCCRTSMLEVSKQGVLGGAEVTHTPSG
ncbi:hypothetical protein M405DRAFT_327845 [Rhizopogon salebrosus TDB-379]|nr:hypothetical protein M405DRAFT_327845 [Rhizopogon salebrosus TDB-379]